MELGELEQPLSPCAVTGCTNAASTQATRGRRLVVPRARPVQHGLHNERDRRLRAAASYSSDPTTTDTHWPF